VTIRGFREQAIGVPVFAALDGRVRRVQEGQKYTNYGTQTLPWDNHVEIDSGHRSWPHLHLTMIVDDQPTDLWSGPCNATSYWQTQPAIRTDPFARDFTLSSRPFADRADLPWDDAVRTSTFAPGTHDLWFRSLLFNAETTSSQLVQLIHPDGSVALADGAAPAWSRWRQTDAIWHERANLDVPGRAAGRAAAYDGRHTHVHGHALGRGFDRPDALLLVPSWVCGGCTCR
jgi:hypothetical protein